MGAEGAWSNQLLNLLIIAASSAGFSGFFIYSPAPGPGNLVASFAASAGTDPYGNMYPADLTIGLNTKTQIQIASNGGVGVVEFLLNNAGFVNGLLESAVIGSFAQIVLNGPASTVAGHQDFVGFEMNSSDGVSSLANMQFIYTNTSGGSSVIGSWNGNGWTLGATSIAGLTVTSGETVSGTAQFNNDVHISGTLYGVGGVLTIGDNINANALTITIPNGNIDLNMASPPNYPTSGKTLAQTQACLDGLIGSMINRQLVA
jgi:hypothetical protein